MNFNSYLNLASIYSIVKKGSESNNWLVYKVNNMDWKHVSLVPARENMGK